MTLVELDLYCCYTKGRWFDSLFSWLRATLLLQHQRPVPTEPMSLSFPGLLELQPLDKGNDIRFSKTLKQGSATHGPRKGTDFQASITVFERYCQGRIKGTIGLRLNR